MINFERISIALLDPNTGQIPGVPKNPRKWGRRELQNLADSMKDTPELTEARGCIVVPWQGRFVVLGGNMRLAAAAIKTPKTQKGDIWQLGDQFLMCGDSTSAEDVARLMDGTRADLSVTDPPYNVDYTGKTADKLKIGQDCMGDHAFHDFLVAAFTRMNEALKPGAANYVFFACKETRNFIDAYIQAGFLYKQLLIWVKNTIILTRSDYQWQHEPCIYGWKDGAPHYFTDDRTLRTVVDEWPDFDQMDKAALRDFCKRVFDRDALATDIVREDKPTRNAEHPTMKPIPLMGRFIRNSSRRGQSVIDLFGGSGSTLMACEQLGRRCRTMEYDPKYCDVIITRWEKYTGRKATKIE